MPNETRLSTEHEQSKIQGRCWCFRRKLQRAEKFCAVSPPDYVSDGLECLGCIMKRLSSVDLYKKFGFDARKNSVFPDKNERMASTAFAFRFLIWKKTDGHCFYCGVELDPLQFHMDHVHPRSKGGRKMEPNMVPACASCNIFKAERTIEEFRARIIQKIQFSKFQLMHLSRVKKSESVIRFFRNKKFLFWFERMGL
jgi:HNH endonuclease